MNIAYDLRYATDRFPGIGTHAGALAAALLERDRIASLTLLWNPGARNTRFDLEPLRRHPRARWLDIDVPAMAPDTAYRTGRVLSRLGVDVFLSPFWLRPERTRVPVVLTLHDVLPLALPELMSPPRRWLYAWAMGRAAGADAILTSSRFSRGEILRLTNVPASRLHVVPLGVESSRVVPQQPAGLPEGPFALVVAANRAHKGLDTLAAVWRGFAGAAPLRLVSAGSVAAGGVSLAEAARAQTAITVLGQVPAAELEWLFRNATLVLVPSRYEGFGLPLLEAAARGAPVIASDIPALRETGEGVVRFVAPGDSAAWASAVRALAADGAERERMSTAGLARVREYGHAKCAASVEAVLTGVLNSARGVAA